MFAFLLMLTFWLFQFVFWILQSEPILSPTVVALVTAAFTVVVGAVGAVYLKDKVNGSSRAKGLISGLLAAYGIVAPSISNLPRGWGVAIALVGLLVTLFSGRVQGQDPADVKKEAKKAT